MNARPVRVLLVDDDEKDIFLTKRALERERVSLDLQVVHDGQECMDYLNKVAPYEDAKRPDLILLDIKMPRKNGLEVLAEMEENPKLASIPVVVLTTSRQDTDIFQAYKHRASCYIVKPVEFEDFKDVVSRINTFWLSVVTFPGEEDD